MAPGHLRRAESATLPYLRYRKGSCAAACNWKIWTVIITVLSGAAATPQLTPAQALAWFDGYIAPYEAASNFDAFAFTYFGTSDDGNTTLAAATRGRCYTLDGTDNGPPNPDTSLFRIASVGKVITAVAVMQLVEQGRLDLDAPLVRYMPYLAALTQANITVKDTLRHTVGIDDRALNIYLRDDGVHETLEAGIAAMWTAQIVPPGTRISYSNFGLTLAGALVEAVAAVPLIDYVRSKVASPLNFSGGVYFHRDLAGDYRRVCYSRRAAGAEPYQVRTTPSGDYYMAANDLARLMGALAYGGRGLFTNTTTVDTLLGRVYPTFLDGLALVFRRQVLGGRLILAKNGGLFHFASNAALYPETADGYIALSTTGMRPASVFIEEDMMYHLLTDNNLTTVDQPTFPYPVPETCDSARIAAIAGAYFGSRGGQKSPLKAIYLFRTDHFAVDGCTVYNRGVTFAIADVPGVPPHQLVLQANTSMTNDQRINVLLLVTYATNVAAEAPPRVVQIENFLDQVTAQPATWSTSSATVYTLLSFFIVALLLAMIALPALWLRARRRRNPVSAFHFVGLVVSSLAWVLIFFVIALIAAPYPAIYLDVHPSWVAIQVLLLLHISICWAGAVLLVIGVVAQRLHSGPAKDDETPEADNVNLNGSGGGPMVAALRWLQQNVDGQTGLIAFWLAIAILEVIGFPAVYAVNFVSFNIW